MTDTDKIAFQENIEQIISFAVDTKARLKARGKRRGHRKCPVCAGRVNAVLAGPRNHIHMACETQGCHMRMME